MRIMGLDVGEKRIGVAVSDGLGITAQGITVIQRRDVNADTGRLKSLIAEHEVGEIVVGRPLNFNNTEGPKAKEIAAFAAELEKAVNLPVRLWDERLSTVSAERVLLEGDTSRAKRRQVIDKLAAQIILQNYLDSRE